jgi:hypothetical protein
MRAHPLATFTLALCLALVLVPAAAAGQAAAEPAAPAPGAAGPAPEAWERTNTHPIRIFGYFWTDTGLLKRINTRSGDNDQDADYMQGRFVVAGAYERRLAAGWYGKAQLELFALVNEYSNASYQPHIGDAWLKVGTSRFDLQVGRFLAWEVYYRGQGIELYSAEEAGAKDAPGLYWLELARGHMNQPGQAAIHWYPLDGVGVEVAGVYGQETSQNFRGVRPAVDLNLSRLLPGLKLIGGFEYLQIRPQIEIDKVESTQHGYAGRLQYSYAPAGHPWLRAPAGVSYSEEAGRGWTRGLVTVGVEAARTSADATRIEGTEDSEKTFDKTTYGAFADVDVGRSSVGLGYHHTVQENAQREETKHDQLFASYLLRLPIPGLSVKAVYGFARGDLEDVDTGAAWQNDLHSFRIRVRYDFE